jgi:hypothetical protein
MEDQVLKIMDGTIPNINHVQNDRTAKCWVAVVERDLQAMGGLARRFLPRASNGRVVLSEVQPGAWLEFAGDRFSTDGIRNQNRTYFQVQSVTNSEISLKQCWKDSIGKQDSIAFNPLQSFTTEQLQDELLRREQHISANQEIQSFPPKRPYGPESNEHANDDLPF